MSNVVEAWESKSPEPSGPHRACYGTPLHLPLCSVEGVIKVRKVIVEIPKERDSLEKMRS